MAEVLSAVVSDISRPKANRFLLSIREPPGTPATRWDLVESSAVNTQDLSNY